MDKKYSILAHAVRLTSLAALAVPASALAGGFALNEQSANAMGVANAGTAANPENATTVLYNPAGMSQLSGTNISFGAAVLGLSAEAKSAEARRNLPGPVPLMAEGSLGGDIADPAILPNFFLTHEVNESIDVGFGIHAPYGLAADYDNDFVGRFFADETELTAIAFTPSISVSNGNGLSMGAGINLIYAEGTLTRYQDLSARIYPAAFTAARQGGASEPQADQVARQAVRNSPEPYADVEGDDIGATFRVGFLYEFSPMTQIGLSAQTGTELDLKGDATISNFPVPSMPGQTTTLTERVRVPLAIPESATLGLRHRFNDEFTLLAGATYAKWSRFDELDIFSREGQSGEISRATGRQPGQPITHITEKWNNTWEFNLGGIWQATPEWALKAGYAWQESPVGDFVTARIPSSDRHWLSLGAQWKDARSGWAIDAAVGTLLFTDDPSFTERNYQHDNPTQVANLAPGGPEDPSYFKGEYELDAWNASVQISKAF